MLLQGAIFSSLVLTTFGTVEVDFLRGVPRLSNTSYWDYYFSCTTTGRTLQWFVNTSALGEFSQGIAQVLFGTNSDFSFITTLLVLKPSPQGITEHTSLLIVTCQGNCDFEATCTNGSLNVTRNIENKLGVNDKINDSFTFLEYLFTESISKSSDSERTSVFVCGVKNMFMTWQVNRNDFQDLSFTTNDNLKQDRRILQENDTTVKLQGIFIGQELYPVISVLILADTSESLTVTCGFPGHEVNLTMKQSLTTSKNFPEDMSSAYYNESTTTSTKNNSGLIAAIVSSIILFFCVLITAVAICFAVLKYVGKQKSHKIKNDTIANEINIDNSHNRSSVIATDVEHEESPSSVTSFEILKPSPDDHRQLDQNNSELSLQNYPTLRY